MAEQIDAVTIINRALARIGGGSITSLDEDSDLARQVLAIWSDVSDAALSAYSWNWNRRSRQLDLLAETPVNGFSYAFGFPGEALSGPFSLSASDGRATIKRFSVEGRTVYCNVAAIVGRFPMRVDPAEWPAEFRTAVTVWLAGEFALPVAQDNDMREKLIAQAIGLPSEQGRGGMMGRAIGNDKGRDASLPDLAAHDPLTQARFDSGYPWHGDL